jgi:hypothetical protein
VIDPVSNIVDQLAEVAPPARDGGADYQWVNKKVLGFVKSLRTFDVNVVLVGHEKLNDGKKGDGKMYPALGGATLINKLLAEMDIVAHIERVPKPTETTRCAACGSARSSPATTSSARTARERSAIVASPTCRDGSRWRMRRSRPMTSRSWSPRTQLVDEVKAAFAATEEPKAA